MSRQQALPMEPTAGSVRPERRGLPLPDLGELLSEIERAVDSGFMYDLQFALSVAAAARDGAEPLGT